MSNFNYVIYLYFQYFSFLAVKSVSLFTQRQNLASQECSLIDFGDS